MPASTPTVASPRQDPPVADTACAVCPHPVAAHDAVAQRYCRATRDTAADRGCVCRTD